MTARLVRLSDSAKVRVETFLRGLLKIGSNLVHGVGTQIARAANIR